MKPGARIRMIKESATKLSEYEWSDIDLILRQFDLPWSDRWEGGDRYAYCLEHIEGSPDEKILELREYLLGGNDQDPDLEDLTGPWAPQRFRLFASHLHTDAVELSELKGELAAYGIDTFVAHEDILPTKEWQREIEGALDTCDAVLAYLTPDFHNSLWVDQEIGYCINRRILVVPLRLGIDPYGLMGKFQGLQCRNIDAEVIAKNVFMLLVHHSLTSARMAEGLLGRFEDSENYESANRLAELLDEIESWTPELLRRLENAPKANGQVAEAWTAQRTVPRILRQERE